MSNLAIRVENLSKRFFIGGPRRAYSTFRDTLMDAIKAPARRAFRLMRGHATAAAELHEEIWALNEVSFEVQEGEVVGIIGRNGAGKSTLLKILSRITEPTRGCAEIHGRVGSLLEVGTGFHQELTGRENVFLNGAILGMRRVEIQRKFDEIVAFADVERFIDTPVKHYSSGMSVRLAFAVAAHLEPEILVIDEVLAVGDASFQRKCIHKMQDVGQHGRTVLFVSHNMPAVTRLCERVILLEDGRLTLDGQSDQVVGHYLNSELGTMAAREWSDPEKAPGGEVARLVGVRACTEDGQISESMDIREPVLLEMEFLVRKGGYKLLPNFQVFNQDGIHLFGTIDQTPEWRGRARPEGKYVSRARIPGNYLAEGTLIVGAALVTADPEIHQFYEREAVAFHVVDSMEGDSARMDWAGKMKGVIRPLLPWSTEFTPAEEG